METKRIRKARRQGLPPGKDLAVTPRVRIGGPQRLADIERGEPRPNRERETRVTVRKAKRQSRAPAKR